MTFNIAYINQLIADGVEENNSLEYKSSGALNKTDSCKKEIAKDVSAFANADGGLLIYGIKEFDEPSKKHLPEKITPINRTEFSKESLEQIINQSISPKVEGLRIYPIDLEKPNEVIYVVEIPKSNTAHQNLKERRYHRRYNFEVLDMLDYEIRDVMNRQKDPIIDLEFEIITTLGREENHTGSWATKKTELEIRMKNNGSVYANYVNFELVINKQLLAANEAKFLDKIRLDNSGRVYVKIYEENTFRDLIDYEYNLFGGKHTYGPSRFDPILPNTKSRVKEIKLNTEILDFNDEIIFWTVYADNAQPREGKIKIGDIKKTIFDENE